MRPADRLWAALRLAGDVGLAAAGLYGAFLLRVRVPLPFTEQLLPAERIVLAAATGGLTAAMALQVATLYFFGFYDPTEPQPQLETARRLLPAVALQGLLLTSYYFLTEMIFPRSVLILYLLVDFVLLLVWHGALDRLHAPPRRRVALVGCGREAREIAEKIAVFGFHGLEVVGYVTPPGGEPPQGDEAAPLGRWLGGIEALPELVREGRIDDVILATGEQDWRARLIDELAVLRPAGADVLLLPGPFESLVGRMRFRWVRDVPLIEVVNHSEWRIRRPLKRFFDLVAGALLLLLALPVMAAVAAAVRSTSRGPVLYRQERVGRGGRRFVLWKFRTMRDDAERDTGEVLSQPGDPRLTPLGATLRRYRLDELPQLWNVLDGTMSLVGPRPERPGFVARFREAIPGYSERLAVAPGLTGLAQISGEYLSSPENKLRYDLAYIANWSLWLDLSILLRTVKIVLTSRGT
jgi:exopolysaccharide biosynthesis polyprenyl glycosylphosphotransferase